MRAAFESRPRLARLRVEVTLFRVGRDGVNRRKGSKVCAVADTLGHVLMPRVTFTDEQDRAQVERLAQEVHGAAVDSVTA